MYNNPEGIPVISRTWSEDKKKSFIRNLERHGTFGFSRSFSQEEMINTANFYGVKVRPLPIRHEYYKKYGPWMLKVTKKYKKKEKKNIKASRLIHNKRCTICKRVIKKGDKAISISKGKYRCIDCHLKRAPKTMTEVFKLLELLS